MNEPEYSANKHIKEQKTLADVFLSAIQNSFHTTFYLLSGILAIIVSLVFIINWRKNGEPAKKKTDDVGNEGGNKKRRAAGETGENGNESEEDLPWLLQNDSSDTTTSSLCKERSVHDNREVETLQVQNNEEAGDSESNRVE